MRSNIVEKYKNMRRDNVRKVIFRRGDENRIVIEEGNFREILFQQQYLNAMQSFISVCQLQDRMSIKSQTMGTNIISFCGDRGEGKSSCMYTVRRILNKHDVFTFDDAEMQNEQEIRYQQFAQEVDAYPTYALPVIDPSFFDDEHNILDLVVSQLYQEAFRDEEGNDIEESYEESEALLQRFNRVKESMSTLMKNKREILDNIEDLDRLGESLQLQKKLTELFDEFLKHINKRDAKERKKLLICIDDLDLNVNGGYTMLEQIRKYLSSEHCVILIALKIEQMTKVVQNALYENSGKNNRIIGIEACREMAEKYITKMFPAEHRVNMPTVDEIVNYRVELREAYDDAKEPHKEWGTIKEAVVSQIFLKTRYLFYNTEHEVNRIIPRNLRSLRQLLAMLLKMDNFKKGSRISRENQWAFKKYFYYEWTNILPEEQQALVNGIIRYSDVSTKNHYVLSTLITPELIGADTALFEWFNAKVRAYNVSVGDVLYVIQELQDSGHAELGNLLFFLQSYYSICLYEYYDELVGEVEDAEDSPALYEYKRFKWDGDYIVERNEEKQSHREIYAHDARFQGVAELQQFVGGAYYMYKPGELLPEESITIRDDISNKVLYNSMPRDTRGLRAKEVFAFMRHYVRNCERNSILNKSDKTGLLGFRLCEFFALTTKMVETAADSRAGTYRNQSYPYYLLPFRSGQTIVVFDIMAIFSNIVNLRFAYDRFNEVLWGSEGENKSFFELAWEQEGSLLREILNPYMQTAADEGFDNESLRYAYAMGRFASAGIIRNVDVHRSLYTKGKADRDRLSRDAKSGATYLGRIIDFYTKIRNFDITLYGDANVGIDQLYQINYEKLFDPILSLLHEIRISNSEAFELLFKSYEERNSKDIDNPLLYNHPSAGRQILLKAPVEISEVIGSIAASRIQYIQDEIASLDWTQPLDGEFIKRQLSKETLNAIPARIRQSITKRHKFNSPAEFMGRVIELIKEYNIQ